MKQMILVVRNKKDEEITLTLEAHKVPVSIAVGSSSIDFDMEEIGELIQVLHTIKAQHKTFVDVQPINKSNVYANLPTPPKVEQKKDYVEYFKEQGVEKEIQLKVGQKYKAVDGDIWTVECKIPSDDWRYRDGYRFLCKHVEGGCISSFMPNGNLFDDEAEYDDNLIELVEDVPTQKDKDENGRWILNVGDQVDLSNGCVGEVLKIDDSCCPYKIMFTLKGDTDYEWFYGTEQDKKGNGTERDKEGNSTYIKSIIRK